MAYTPALPWEEDQKLHDQNEFADVSDFAAAMVFRRFSSIVEHRLKELAIQEREDPSIVFNVEDEFGPQDVIIEEILCAFVVIAKRGLSPLMAALVAWQGAVIRKSEGATFRKASINYLFCRIALKVLATASSENLLLEAVAENVEDIAFAYFQENPRVGKGAYAGLSEQDHIVFELFGEVLGLIAGCSDRLNAISSKMFGVVEEKIKSKNIALAVSLVGALHYVPLSCSTNERLNASVAFLKKAQTYYGKKAKISEMKQALCELMGHMLAPLIDEARVEGVSYSSWYETVEKAFETFSTYGKKAKAPAIVLPTRTALMCVGSPKKFLERRGPFLADFFKHIKPGDKLLLTSLECLYRLLLGMSMKSSGTLKDVSSKVAERLFPPGAKKTILTEEGCVEVVVDIINIISVDQLQFAVDEIVAGLLKSGPGMPLRMMVGMLAFNSIMERLGVAAKAPASAIRADMAKEASSLRTKGKKGHTVAEGSRSSRRAFRESTIKRRTATDVLHVRKASTEPVIADFTRNVGAAVDAVFDLLDPSLGNMLETDPRYHDKGVFDVLPKDVRPSHVKLFRTALACVRRAVPPKRGGEELMSLLVKYTLHCDPVVRVEALSVLRHIMRTRKGYRSPVLQEYSRLIGGMPDSDRAWRTEAAQHVIDLMQDWHGFLVSGNDPADKTPVPGDAEGGEAPPPFPAGSLDGLALLLMCDRSPAARTLALRLASATASLSALMPAPLAHAGHLLGEVLAEKGGAILQHALHPLDGLAIPGTSPPPALPEVKNERGFTRDVNLTDVALEAGPEAPVWWSRALRAVVKELLARDPGSPALHAAHKSALRKLQQLQKGLEGDLAKAKQGHPLEDRTARRVFAWRNYGVLLASSAACCCESPEASAALFSLLLSNLRSTAEEFLRSLLVVVSSVTAGSVPTLLAALQPYVDEVFKGKKGSKDARLRGLLATCHHLAAATLPPEGYRTQDGVLGGLLEYIGHMHAFLKDLPAQGGSAPPPLLRYNFYTVLHRTLQGLGEAREGEARFELLSMRRHEALFNACYRGCGHLVLEEDKKTRRATIVKLQKHSRTNPDEAKLQHNEVVGVEKAALRAMAALLQAGAWGDHVVRPDGPVFLWLTEVFKDADEEVRSIGREALTAFVLANRIHEEALFHYCVDLCYHSNPLVAHAAFRGVMGLIMGEAELAFPLPVVLNLCMFFIADTEASIRKLAVRALNFAAGKNQFEIASSGVSETYLAIQTQVAARLADSFSDAAPAIIAEVWRRVTMMERDQTLVLRYLPAWLRKIDLTQADHPDDLMEKLMAFTLKFGNERPGLVEQLWTGLVRGEGEEENLEVVVTYLVNTACLLRNSYFLATARKVAVSLARCDPSRAVSRLAGLLFNTKVVKGAQVEEEEAKLTMQPPDMKQWEFSALFPVFDVPELALHRSEVASFLLIELATEVMDVVEQHVPMLLHVGVLGCDSGNSLVCTYSKLLVSNVVYNYARLRGGGEEAAFGPDSPVSQLIAWLESLEEGAAMWTKEDPSLTLTSVPSAAAVRDMVQRVLAALPTGDLKSEWAAAAIRWTSKIGRVQAHYVYRSLQVYRGLEASITPEALQQLVTVLYKHCVKRTDDKIGLSLEIMQTLIHMAQHAPLSSLQEHPQLFWAPMALAHSAYEEEYRYAMQAVLALLQRLVDEGEEEVAEAMGGWLLARPPSWPSGLPCQPLFEKGLTSPITAPTAIAILQRTLTLPGEVPLLSPSPSRHTRGLLGLLPWLCVRLSPHGSEEPREVARRLSPLLPHPLGAALQGYASLAFADAEEFLAAIAGPLQQELFPAAEGGAVRTFALLTAMLHHSPPEWQRPLLALIGKLLVYDAGFPPALTEEGVGMFAGLERCLQAADPDMQELVLKVVDGLVTTRTLAELDIHNSDSISAAERMVDFHKSLDRVWTAPDRGAPMVTRCLIELLQTFPTFETRSVPPPL